MKNIFENAYFGKAYKTRDGRKTIYLGCRDSWHILSPQDYNGIIAYKEKGFVCEGEEQELDIISEWQEPIDEEKLDKKFNEFVNSDDFKSSETPYFYFTAGYKKAKEE